MVVQPKYMTDFIIQLQALLVKSLKRKGSSIKRGKITITPTVEKYLVKKFDLSRRLENSNLLNTLGFDQSICKGLDKDQSTISDFRIRLGRKSKVEYTIPCGIKKVLEESPIVHWEFSRMIEMNHDLDSVSVWNEKHKARITKWLERG